jgi:hypothetical protein
MRLRSARRLISSGVKDNPIVFILKKWNFVDEVDMKFPKILTI